MKKIVLPLAFVALFSRETSAEDGARLFQAKCQTCHGTDGKGNPALKKVYGPGINIVDEASQAKDDAEWQRLVAEGAVKGKMPAFKKTLSEENIGHIIAYVRSLAPREPTE